MSKLKNFAQKNFNKLRRRHTDSGEHTLSILHAKIELINESVPISDVSPEYINSDVSKFKDSDKYLSVDHWSHHSRVCFIYHGFAQKIPLPKSLNFRWLLSTYFEAFNIPASSTASCFYVQFPNTSFFQKLQSPEQLIDRSVLFLSDSNVEIEELSEFYSLVQLETLFESSFPIKTCINLSGISPFDSNIPPHIDLYDDSVSLNAILSSISSVSKRLINLQGYLLEFRKETVCLHVEYRNFFTEKSDSILATLNHLKFLSPRSTIPKFRTDRLSILDLEKFYLRDSHRIYSEAFTILPECDVNTREASSRILQDFQLEFLDTSVEFIRVDASQRGCLIIKDEVEELYKSVFDIKSILEKLTCTFDLLDPKLRRIISFELETIVQEEEMLSNERNRLVDSICKCRDLNQTLLSLIKLGDIQSSRVPKIVDIIVSPMTANVRNTLMSEIRNISIDHEARIKLIDLSCKISSQKKNKILKPIDIFTKNLENQKKILRKTNNLSVINNRYNVNYHRWFEEFKRERFLQIQRLPNDLPYFNESHSNATSAGLLSDWSLNCVPLYPDAIETLHFGFQGYQQLNKPIVCKKYFPMPIKQANLLHPVPGPPDQKKKYEPKYLTRVQNEMQDICFKRLISKQNLSVV